MSFNRLIFFGVIGFNAQSVQFGYQFVSLRLRLSHSAYPVAKELVGFSQRTLLQNSLDGFLRGYRGTGTDWHVKFIESLFTYPETRFRIECRWDVYEVVITGIDMNGHTFNVVHVQSIVNQACREINIGAKYPNPEDVIIGRNALIFPVEGHRFIFTTTKSCLPHTYAFHAIVTTTV